MDGNQERTLETARILVNNYQDVLNRDEETSEEDSDTIGILFMITLVMK